MRPNQSVYLCSVVYANLNESTLLVVEYTVVGVLPVTVVVELHASREAFWVFRGHQHPVKCKCKRKITLMQTFVNIV